MCLHLDLPHGRVGRIMRSASPNRILSCSCGKLPCFRAFELEEGERGRRGGEKGGGRGGGGEGEKERKRRVLEGEKGGNRNIISGR